MNRYRTHTQENGKEIQTFHYKQSTKKESNAGFKNYKMQDNKYQNDKSPCLLVIILSVTGMNFPVKRQKMDRMDKNT
jgi:hypothetical protein